MNTLKANTVHQLQELLNKFDKTLPVAVFDCDRGYMSVAFKKEEKVIKEGKTFQWLTFYAHETIPMYTIDTLLGYLSKLPPQATIMKLTEEDTYTSLYLSLDGLKDKGKSYQWLVINDELEYNRFFKQNDTSYTELALEKMLAEMNDNNSQSVERIHQWLCKQTNQDLFKGILTDGKTMNGALTYCSQKAQELAKNDRFAMVEDDTVYQWVSDYFIHYDLPKPTPQKKGKTQSATKTKPKPVNMVTKKTSHPLEREKGGSEQQLDLFATV